MPPKSHVGTPFPELTLEQAYKKACAERDAFDARRSQAARSHPMGSLGAARVTQQIPPYGSVQIPDATPKPAPVRMPRPYHPMNSLGGRWAKGVAVMPHVSSTSSASSALAGSSSAVVPTPKPKLGVDKRRDAPAINYSARGDRRRGLEVARSPELLDAAVHKYNSEVRSAGDTSDAYVKTWSDFHDQINWVRLGMPVPCPVIPLTPKKIMVIGAVLKEAGYRSTHKSIYSIQRHHILFGCDWNDQLDLPYTSFVASTQRGIGPGKQSCPIPFGKMVDIDLNAKLVLDTFLVKPGWCCVLFTFFLLRELELATARRTNCRVNHKTKSVTMRLTASKRDPEAIGIERTWGCVCDANTSEAICPYHAASRQLDLLEARFGAIHADDDLALFPTCDGRCVEGDIMVKVVEIIATRQGQVLKTADGVTRFGGHSWRATGAVYLSSLGIHMHKIALLARWASAVITHYTRIAPLKSLTEDFKRRQMKSTPNDDDISPSKLLDIGDELKSTMTAALETRVKDIVKDAKENDTRIRNIMDKCFAAHETLQNKIDNFIKENSKRTLDKPLCINTRTKVTHKVLTSIQTAGNEARTWCMWKYAKGYVRLIDELGVSGDHPCKECYPEYRKS